MIVKNIPINENENQEKSLRTYFAKYLEDEIDVAPEVKQVEKMRAHENKNYKPLKRVVCVNLCYKITEMVEKGNAKDALIAKKQKVLTQLYDKGLEPGDYTI